MNLMTFSFLHIPTFKFLLYTNVDPPSVSQQLIVTAANTSRFNFFFFQNESSSSVLHNSHVFSSDPNSHHFCQREQQFDSTQFHWSSTIHTVERLVCTFPNPMCVGLFGGRHLATFTAPSEFSHVASTKYTGLELNRSDFHEYVSSIS